MKLLSMTLFFILTLFTGSIANAQATGKACAVPPPPIGDLSEMMGKWEGSYTYQGETHDCQITFSKEDDKLIATASLPAFNVEKGTFKTRVCSSQELHFGHMTLINHYVEFIGRPKNGVMKGYFKYQEDLNVCTKPSGNFSLSKVESLVDKM